MLDCLRQTAAARWAPPDPAWEQARRAYLQQAGGGKPLAAGGQGRFLPLRLGDWLERSYQCSSMGEFISARYGPDRFGDLVAVASHQYTWRGVVEAGLDVPYDQFVSLVAGLRTRPLRRRPGGQPCLISSGPLARTRPASEAAGGDGAAPVAAGLYLAAAAAIVLLATALFAWRQAAAGQARLDRDIAAAVQRDALVQTAGDTVAFAAGLDPAASAHWRTAMERQLREHYLGTPTSVIATDLTGNIAQVRVLVASADPGAPATRETRFYRLTADGWQLTEPPATLWGATQTLDTRYFRFRYSQRDADVVAAVAARADGLYEAMVRDFGFAPIEAGAGPGPQFTVDVLPKAIHTVYVSGEDRMQVASPLLQSIPAIAQRRAGVGPGGGRLGRRPHHHSHHAIAAEFVAFDAPDVLLSGPSHGLALGAARPGLAGGSRPAIWPRPSTPGRPVLLGAGRGGRATSPCPSPIRTSVSTSAVPWMASWPAVTSCRMWGRWCGRRASATSGGTWWKVSWVSPTTRSWPNGGPIWRRTGKPRRHLNGSGGVEARQVLLDRLFQVLEFGLQVAFTIGQCGQIRFAGLQPIYEACP